MKGHLYIVATPIGNLGDITLRALETLKNVDFILCEDTRVTKNLLDHYQIHPVKSPVGRPPDAEFNRVKPQLISYHQHSDATKIKEIIGLLEDGKNLALVTDAGTPGISDPGGLLVATVIASLAKQSHGDDGIAASLPAPRNDNVIPIPGPSAAVAALSISGFPTDKFVFMGFPPHKNKRQKYFKEVADAEYTVVFYESGHRINKCLQELKEVLSPERQIVVCRELTKKFETIYRGNADQIIEQMKEERGEFVLVVNSL